MAIKTSAQGSIPAITLDHVQCSEFHVAVQEESPNTVSISAKVKAYGVADGVKYYDKKPMRPLSIPNLDAYLSTKVPADRLEEAMQAVVKIQEGQGVLVSIFYGIDFEGVE